MIKKLKTQFVFKSILSVTAFTLLIVVFNNMTQTNSILPFQLESQKISDEISKNRLSKKAKGVLIQHKKFITGLIATKSGSQNCHDLIKADPYMVTGQYVVRNKNNKKFYFLHCVVENEKVKRSKIITEIKSNSASCSGKKSCLASAKIYKNKECRSQNGKITFCNFPMLIDKPSLHKELSKNTCVRGKTFGVNLNGMWVDKGCHAIFKVAEIPLTEEFLTPHRKVLGYLDSAVLDGSHIVVKGWACQFGENNPVSVNFYVRGQKGVGQWIHWVKSDQPSSKLVSQRCGVASTNHRFEGRIPVTSALRPGDMLFVEAVSNFKTHPNEYIDRSGLVSVGDVNSLNGALVVGTEGRNIKVSGWACVVGGSSPISVRIDSITQNSHADITRTIASVPVDKPSDNLVRNTCKGGRSAHHFAATIPYPDPYFYGGLGIAANLVSTAPNPVMTRQIGIAYPTLPNPIINDQGR